MREEVLKVKHKVKILRRKKDVCDYLEEVEQLMKSPTPDKDKVIDLLATALRIVMLESIENSKIISQQIDETLLETGCARKRFRKRPKNCRNYGCIHD